MKPVIRIITLATLIFSPSLFANDVTVFEVQKNIPLTSDEIALKDYYVSGGSQQGVQKGMVITVVRKVPIHDNLKNKSQGFLTNPIARLQVIHVENEFSIGRLYAGIDRDNLPVLDFEGIMVGDILDMGTALIPSKKAKRDDKDEKREEAKKEDVKVETKELKAEVKGESSQSSSLPSAGPIGKPSP